MTITRLGTERRRMSKIVIHNDTIYLCGQVAKDSDADIKEQTRTMLEKVDDGSMGFTPAVQLSFLKKKEQKEMLDAMEFAQCTPSYQQTLSGWISPNCAKRVCWRKGY